MQYNFLSDEISLYGDSEKVLETVLEKLDYHTECLKINAQDLTLFHIFPEANGNKIAPLDKNALLNLETRKILEVGKLENDLFSEAVVIENTIGNFNNQPAVGFFLTLHGRILEVNLDAMYMLISKLAIQPRQNRRKSFVRNAYIALQLLRCNKEFVFVCRKDFKTGKTRVFSVFEKDHVYNPQKNILQIIKRINTNDVLASNYGLLKIKKWSLNQQKTRIWCEFENSDSSIFLQGILFEISDTGEKGWSAFGILRKKGAKNYLIGDQLNLKANIAEMSEIIIRNYSPKGIQIERILSAKEKNLLFSDIDLMLSTNWAIHQIRMKKLLLKVLEESKIASLIGKKRTAIVVRYILESLDFSRYLTEAEFILILMSIPEILESLEGNIPPALKDAVAEVAFKLPFQKFDFKKSM